MSKIPDFHEPIKLTKQGEWFHGDGEITHQRTIDLFFKSIEFKDGKYFLRGEKMPVPIIVEDVAYFVVDIENKKDHFFIKLSDGTSEKLNLETLDTGEENQLYCKIKNGTVRAKFPTRLYYFLMDYLKQKDGFLGLEVFGGFYPLQEISKGQPNLKNPSQVKKDSSKQKSTTKKKASTKKKPSVKKKVPAKKKETRKVKKTSAKKKVVTKKKATVKKKASVKKKALTKKKPVAKKKAPAKKKVTQKAKKASAKSKVATRRAPTKKKVVTKKKPVSKKKVPAKKKRAKKSR